MGDRCYCTVTCREADLVAAMPDWKEKFGSQWESRDGGVLTLAFDQVNYADVFVSEGFPDIPCLVENSPGCEYGAGVTANFGDDRYNWDTDSETNTWFAFAVDESGVPILTDDWRDFWALYQKVRKHLDEVREKKP